MRVGVAVLAVVLVGGLGWLLFGGAGPDEGTLPVEEQGGDAGDAPTLRASGSTRAEPGDPGAARDGSADSEGDEAPKAPPHLVVGRVEGLGAGEIGETTVRVRGLQQYDWIDKQVEAAEAPLGHDGTFAVDIGAVRAVHAELARIQVEVDHPAYVLHKTKLDLAPLDQPRTEVTDVITMDRAMAVEVTVHTAAGKPLPEAKVALYGMNGESIAVTEEHDPVVLDRGSTGPTGQALLRTATEGPALIVANGPGHVPTGLRVVLSAREARAPVVLELEAGHVITGRVLLNDEPLPGASIRAYPQIEGEQLRLQHVGATFSEAGLIADGALAQTDAKGAFRFEGQNRSPRNLRIIAVADYFMRNRSIGWSEQLVTPPAEDVEIRLEAAIVDLQVVAGAEPLTDVRIGIAAPNATWRSTRGSPTGEVTMLLPVNKPMVIFAEHKHHEKAERTLDGLAPGTRVREVLDMGPAKAAATLRVTLKGPDGTPITSAGFLLEEDEDGPIFMGFDDGLGLRKSKDGVFVLENLEPGTFIVAVFPERSPEGYRGTWVVHQQKVQLIEGREQSIEVTARRGGAVIVSGKNEEGRFLDCFATLRDDEGKEIEVSWFWSTETSASMSTSGPGAAPSRLLPPLAPGEYELELGADGYQSRKVRFRVTAGETKPLDIVLEKE